MKFGKFNKQRLFTVDTSSFDYIGLDQAAAKYGENVQVRLRGLYLSDKSNFAAEAPILATDEEYINLPQHQLDEVKSILKDPVAIRAINDGECGFEISSYYQKRFAKTCYKVTWVDYTDCVGEDDEEVK